MPKDGVYLTFDDGPHSKATPEILKVLQTETVRATFFLTGQNIEGQEGLVREIAGEGHTLGNHGFQHSRLPAFSRQSAESEILRTDQILSTITPTQKKFFRPPHGFFTWNTVAAAKSLGYQIVMWTTLTGDFRGWSNSRVVATALQKLTEGSILVFHDNQQTAGRIGPVVSECIQRIREAGYRFQTV